MAEIKIKCIHCGSEEVVKIGKQRNGTPRCIVKQLEKPYAKRCQKTCEKEEFYANIV